MGWASYNEDNISRVVSNNHALQAQQNAPLRARKKQGKVKKQEMAKEQKKKVSKLNNFTMSTARPLPVIVLADVSGSMSADGKIDALNAAVVEMIEAFAEEDDARAEIHVSVITFGGSGASVHTPLRSASDVQWESMPALGRTPMGGAFQLAQAMVEDREAIPSRAYRPIIVLLSDGEPNDDWEAPLASLLKSERASKATRFAMAVGADADSKPLADFLGSEQERVFEAHEAREIKRFFRWVTMSVTARSRSANPNAAVMIEPTDLDEFDF